MSAQKAYSDWLLSQKIRLQGFTEQQMFILGYETALKDMQEPDEEVKPIKKAKVKKDE
jgi:hypothetical protein